MTRFCGLPASSYPVVLEMFHPDDPWTAAPAWRVEVAAAGVLQVPGFGQPMRVRVAYGNGTVTYTVPNGSGAPRSLACRRRRVDGPTVDTACIPPTEVPDGMVLLQVYDDQDRSAGRRIQRAVLDAGGGELVEREYRILERRLFEAPPGVFHAPPHIDRPASAPGH